MDLQDNMFGLSFATHKPCYQIVAPDLNCAYPNQKADGDLQAMRLKGRGQNFRVRPYSGNHEDILLTYTTRLLS